MEKFICNQCGLCCQNLHLSNLYSDLNDGSGICKYFDKKSNLCKIYDVRPQKCNIQEAYQYFKKEISYTTYLQLNYIMCEQLKRKNDNKKKGK